MSNMKKNRHQFSRRKMLRGIGVSMALPWMESLRVWGDVKLESKQSSKAPTRMGILFSGCGFHTHEWWAKGEGKEMRSEERRVGKECRLVWRSRWARYH